MRRWGLVGLLILLTTSSAWAQAARPDGSVFAAGVTSVTPFGALYATAPPAIADGSVGAPRMDVNRNLQINCLNCAGAAGGTSATDKAGFTGGTSSFTPVGGAFDDVATSTLSEGQLGIMRMTSFRAIHVNLRDNAGNEITSLGGGSQYAQGVAAGDTDLMTMAGCVRADSAAVATGVAAGDVARCIVDATGRLWVHVGVVDGTVAATQSGAWSVGQTGTWTVQPGNTANTTAWLVTGTGGTFPATQSGTWNMRMQDGSGNALTSLSLGAQRAITVSILDGSGNQVTAFSGSGGTASNFTSAFPSAGTAAGFLDASGNMQSARVVDCDTGAGAFWCLSTNLVRRASGGPTELIGQTTMALSLPVTIASDQSAVPVSGTVAATQSGTWNVGTVTAVTAITNALPAGTNVIGVVGNTQGSTTSGQSGELVQGAVTTAAPTYTTAQTSPLSLQTDGSLRTAVTNTVTVGSHAVTNAGTFAVQAAQSGSWTSTVTQATGTNLHMVCDSGCSTSTAPADNSAFTAGTTSSSPASGFYHATRDSVTDGRIAAIAINVNRAQLMQLENSAKTEIGTQTAPIGVRFTDGTNFITPSAVDTDDGTIAGGQANVSLVASLGYLSDGTNWTSRMQQATHGTNSTGAGIQLSALVAEFDDGSTTACTENQFCNGRVSTNRNLYTAIRDGSGTNAERGAAVNASNQLSVSVDNTVTVASHAVTNAGTFAVQSASQGTLAHDAAASAVNPVLIGGFASAAAPADVSADVDAVRAWYLRNGAAVMQPSYAGILASTGNGVAGTGTPRVTIASDNTTFPVTVTFPTAATTSAVAVRCVNAAGNAFESCAGTGGGGGTTDTDDGTIAGGQTVGLSGALNYCWDGSNWVRCGSLAGLAQGSTTSAQLGFLTMGAVTTSAPTYTTAQTSPFSLQTDGSLRTAVTNTITANLGTAGADPFGANADAASNAGSISAKLKWIATAVQVEDAAETAGGGLAMAGTVRRDSAASSAGSTGDNATLNTDANGMLWTRTADPCSSAGKTSKAVNITGTTVFVVNALAGANNYIYVCSYDLQTDAANNVTIAEDDTADCTSLTNGLIGGTTAATGYHFVAGGGIVKGSGTGTVLRTNNANYALCILASASTQLSGSFQYVIAP